MIRFNLIKPVYAHCDLPCGVYDPAQAMIEAKSLQAILSKYPGLDEHNKQRAIIIKEERAELVKKHLMILWADYFKEQHIQKYPDLHNLFWLAIKQASKVKQSLDIENANILIQKISEIEKIFNETKSS
ncbi:MAG: superoxide dismutase, Ni [Patescibacteria group bacterium]|jgi:nickel superoxide dismutase|nr:superoxide dismutase, Ni [Patescibacteria group bacterium]